MFGCTRPSPQRSVKASPWVPQLICKSENSSSVPTCQMFCGEKPYNCQVFFLFCHHVSHPIWFCAQNFCQSIFHAQMWKFSNSPMDFLQSCPTAKKLLFVRGSSWPVTLTRDNVLLPKLLANYIISKYLEFEFQQKQNVKIMLEVITRSETNGLPSYG